MIVHGPVSRTAPPELHPRGMRFLVCCGRWADDPSVVPGLVSCDPAAVSCRPTPLGLGLRRDTPSSAANDFALFAEAWEEQAFVGVTYGEFDIVRRLFGYRPLDATMFWEGR